MDDPDTEDELVLKDKYEMELGTNFSKVILGSTTERSPN